MTSDGSYRKFLNTVNPLGSRGKLANEFASLITTVYREEDGVVVSPTSFKETLCAYVPQFRGGDQHDSQEFLSSLLDALHEDLNQGSDVKGSTFKSRSMPDWMKRIPADQDDDTLPEHVCPHIGFDIVVLRIIGGIGACLV
jgi:ubiquitin carboxyl-terminal hydrolase 8